ncbi:MAG: class I SAM-dependent methyltransferase [Bryobacteraceae bacterium]
MTDLLASGRDFLTTLEKAKADARADFEWYPYNSLSNVQHIAALVGDRQTELLEIARGKGVFDVGCADGDLSFFFESLGCEVVAADHPGPNQNTMRGVRRLKETLKSQVEIRELDLDSQFSPPDRRFGLTLFLGALYHLKNPFYILETLAKCSDFCILSTRIARRFPHLGRVPDQAAIAYLLDTDELNRDETNFWIFSDAGLKLLLRRSSWNVCACRNLGDTSNSDAGSLDRDERVFCLLQSRYVLAEVELISGWHEPEQGGWRWTERRFSIRARPQRIAINVYLPPELLDTPLEMKIRAGEIALPPAIFGTPGRQTIARAIPEGADVVEFELDRAIPPDGSDLRERGIIVSAIRFD